MRIWDVSPGYLSRQHLLGEHRELHGIVSIITNRKTGYARHPETLRWAEYGWALQRRHRLLACEMRLRGYQDRTPVTVDWNPGQWPAQYIDPPARQYELLRRKYAEAGSAARIPLPTSGQALWSQHKYSVLARDPKAYKAIGRSLANGFGRSEREYHELARTLVEILRQRPTPGGIRNAVEHMWGYVSADPPLATSQIETLSSSALLSEVQQRALHKGVAYLLASTALSELMAWLEA